MCTLSVPREPGPVRPSRPWSRPIRIQAPTPLSRPTESSLTPCPLQTSLPPPFTSHVHPPGPSSIRFPTTFDGSLPRQKSPLISFPKSSRCSQNLLDLSAALDTKMMPTVAMFLLSSLDRPSADLQSSRLALRGPLLWV